MLLMVEFHFLLKMLFLTAINIFQLYPLWLSVIEGLNNVSALFIILLSFKFKVNKVIYFPFPLLRISRYTFD